MPENFPFRRGLYSVVPIALSPKFYAQVCSFRVVANFNFRAGDRPDYYGRCVRNGDIAQRVHFGSGTGFVPAAALSGEFFNEPGECFQHVDR